MATHGNGKRNANGQGGVYRRADGRWEAKVFVDTPEGRRKRISVYGDTEQESLNELNKLRDQQRRGIPIATTTLTVSEYMTYWLEQIAEPSIRRTTYATYEEVVPVFDRGRDRPHGRPPAQIPACGTTALGSCLGWLASKRASG